MAEIPRFNPNLVIAYTTLDDLGTAGGDTGTAVVIAPINCSVVWIGCVTSGTASGADTAISLVHSAQDYGSRTTGTILTIPQDTTANSVVHSELARHHANNQWMAGEPIIITSDGGTSATPIGDFTLVLEPR